MFLNLYLVPSVVLPHAAAGREVRDWVSGCWVAGCWVAGCWVGLVREGRVYIMLGENKHGCVTALMGDQKCGVGG